MRDKDMTEKILEAYDDVFADIVNVFLFGGEQVVKEEDLEDASPLSMYKADGELHEQERDVSKFWRRENITLSLIGLENQSKYERDMPLRVIGYDGAGYRAQLLGGGRRYPVISLVLYFGERPWGRVRTLRDALDFRDGRLAPFFHDYGINLFEIAYLTDEQIAMFKSDFRLVAEFFTKSRTDPGYIPSQAEIGHVDAVLKLLSAVTGDDVYDNLTELPKGGKPKTMYEAMRIRDERNIARGEARGRAEGRAEGLARGRIMTYAEFDTPTDEIAAKVGLPREEVERIMREVGIIPLG